MTLVTLLVFALPAYFFSSLARPTVTYLAKRGGNPPLWLKQLANDLGSPCSYFSLVRPTGYVPTVLLPE